MKNQIKRYIYKPLLHEYTMIRNEYEDDEYKVYKIPLFKNLVTNGIMKIMNDGYAWFITDTLAVLDHHPKVREHSSHTILLEINKENKTADMVIKTIDEVELYRQHYAVTNATKNLTLIHGADNIMCSIEEY